MALEAASRRNPELHGRFAPPPKSLFLFDSIDKGVKSSPKFVHISLRLVPAFPYFSYARIIVSAKQINLLIYLLLPSALTDVFAVRKHCLGPYRSQRDISNILI